MRSVKVNFIFSSLKGAMSVLFPVISFPYISRVLGVNKLGQVEYCQSYPVLQGNYDNKSYFDNGCISCVVYFYDVTGNATISHVITGMQSDNYTNNIKYRMVISDDGRLYVYQHSVGDCSGSGFSSDVSFR